MPSAAPLSYLPMMTHLQKYGRAYIVGLLFFVITNAEAFKAVFGHLTPEQIKAFTRFDWLSAIVDVLGLAAVNLLAFVNQSVAKASQPQNQTTNPNP